MDWLEEELGSYDDDYLIFDCPGVWWRVHLRLLFLKVSKTMQDKLNCTPITHFYRLSCRTCREWGYGHVLYI
jgi:hypothetical protein